MSGFDPGDFWYIQLGGRDDKMPRRKWGGYSQSFVASDDVFTHEQVVDSDWDHWGIVGTQRQAQTTSMTTLIFDLDVHKSETPREFGERIDVPDDTTIVKSQSGGFHVYFTVHGERGDLKESDFEMTADVDWDIDIRGSAVSMHVAAPTMPGVDMSYEIVQDEPAKAVIDPADAAERIQLDGEPLLEYSPGRSYGGGIEIDRDVEPPEEMPTCYHRGLQVREANPEDHGNTHKVNVLTALCGLAAGYSVDDMVQHYCEDYAPGPNADTERTEYQLSHLADNLDRGDYSPPALSTLRDYGILDEGETCDCDIPYHGKKTRPSLDVVTSSEEAEQSAPETDGGTAAASPSADRPTSLHDEVQDALYEFSEEIIQAKTARHRIAQAFIDNYHFITPERDVRGWREELYVFNEDEGVYEPRGESFIKRKLERVAGDFTTNNTASEIVEKVRRMTIERGDFQPAPNRLVVGNGVLDLHTGELTPYTPHEYHRTKIDIDWNPNAGEPEEIDAFLHDIVDESDVPTLYRLVAHTLYKEYVGEKAAILIGSGQNGKSVFLDLVEKFIGGYNVTHRELQDFDDDGFAANNLQGKLANLATEIGEQQLNDTTTFKKLTGRDTLDARVKYGSPITFENYATLMFATNEMPIFGQDNHAIWRRWLFVDFPYTFDASDPDAKDPEDKRVLMRRLTQEQELEALLLRCQQEIQRWYEGQEWYADAMGPDEVREKMKRAAEPVYNFAAACLDVPDDEDDQDCVPKDLVRECYNRYADEEDLPRVPANQFGERLMQLRDFQIENSQRRVNGARRRVYTNVKLSARGRQTLGMDEPGDGQSQVGDDHDQPKPIVLEQLQEMVEENGNEPVPINGLVWACAGDIGKTTAEKAVEGLKKQGDVMVVDGDHVIDN